VADYQILKITLKDAGQNETTYFGHEVVGSRALGGNLEPPYPKEKIISVHAYYAKKKGNGGTRLDMAASRAEAVNVQILYKDELLNSTVTDANMIKKDLIAKFAEEHPLDWSDRLLNERFLPPEMRNIRAYHLRKK